VPNYSSGVLQTMIFISFEFPVAWSIMSLKEISSLKLLLFDLVIGPLNCNGSSSSSSCIGSRDSHISFSLIFFLNEWKPLEQTWGKSYPKNF